MYLHQKHINVPSLKTLNSKWIKIDVGLIKSINVGFVVKKNKISEKLLLLIECN